MLIPNKLNITCTATMPDGKRLSEITESNTVSTEILTYSVLKEIRFDKAYAHEGESAHNTVTITNNSATKLFDNLFKIPQLNGTNYVSGSIKVNGIAQPTYNPITGFSLPDLNPGKAVVIEYDIIVNNPMTVTPATHFATLNYTVNDPARGNATYSENTSTLSINVISDKIDVIKSVDKYFTVRGDSLHYTTTITNIGNIIKSDMIFKDPIPEGTTFVSNSIKINGISYSVYNPEIGFAIKSLAPGEVLTVEFDVKVN